MEFTRILPFVANLLKALGKRLDVICDRDQFVETQKSIKLYYIYYTYYIYIYVLYLSTSWIPHGVVINLIVFCADLFVAFQKKTGQRLVRWPELLVEPIFAALKLDWSRLNIMASKNQRYSMASDVRFH